MAFEAFLAGLAYQNELTPGAFAASISAGFLRNNIEPVYGGDTEWFIAELSKRYSGVAAFSMRSIESGRWKVVFDGTDLDYTEGVAWQSDVLADIGLARQLVLEAFAAAGSMNAFVEALVNYAGNAGEQALAKQVQDAIGFVEAEVVRIQSQHAGLSRSDALSQIDLIGHSLGGAVVALVREAYEGRLGDGTAFSAPLPSDLLYGEGLRKVARYGDPISLLGENPQEVFYFESSGELPLTDHEIVPLSFIIQEQVFRLKDFAADNFPEYDGHRDAFLNSFRAVQDEEKGIQLISQTQHVQIAGITKGDAVVGINLSLDRIH